jgi:hypothetical protein
MPICFAVLRLMTNSNFVRCSTGKSAGLAPLGFLSARTPERCTEHVEPLRRPTSDHLFSRRFNASEISSFFARIRASVLRNFQPTFPDRSITKTAGCGTIWPWNNSGLSIPYRSITLWPTSAKSGKPGGALCCFVTASTILRPPSGSSGLSPRICVWDLPSLSSRSFSSPS